MILTFHWLIGRNCLFPSDGAHDCFFEFFSVECIKLFLNPLEFNSIGTCHTLGFVVLEMIHTHLVPLIYLIRSVNSDHLRQYRFPYFSWGVKSIHVLSLIRRFDMIPSNFRFTTGRLPMLMLLTPYWGHLIGTNYSDIISGPTPCGQNLKVLSGHLSTNLFQKS